MKDIGELEQYAPQKIFLVQGSEEYFNTLLSETLARDPFLFSLVTPRLTMEHARTIVSYINEGSGEPRMCLIFFSIFSPDAAQVLLKSLEEPDMHTRAVFVTPYPYLVPQTIRSRILLIAGDDAHIDDVSITTKEAALSYIKKEFDADTDDASVRRAKAVIFLDALEKKMREDPKKAGVVYKAKHMLFYANLPTKYVLEFAVSMTL